MPASQKEVINKKHILSQKTASFTKQFSQAMEAQQALLKPHEEIRLLVEEELLV